MGVLGKSAESSFLSFLNGVMRAVVEGVKVVIFCNLCEKEAMGAVVEGGKAVILCHFREMRR